MKRLEVDDDIKDLLERATRTANTHARLQHKVSDHAGRPPATEYDASGTLRLALGDFIQLRSEQIVEYADAIADDRTVAQ